MANKHMGMYLVISLLLACDATHDVGEQPRDETVADAGTEPDAGVQDPAPQADGGTQPSCTQHTDCNTSTEVCDFGVCRLGCGPNYPGWSCAPGEFCDDTVYICRPKCDAGCPSGTTCDPLTLFCHPPACSAQNLCPPRYGCSAGTCVPIGQECSVNLPCLQGQLCVQGFCQLPCGPNYPGNVCPSGQQCQQSATCG